MKRPRTQPLTFLLMGCCLTVLANGQEDTREVARRQLPTSFPEVLLNGTGHGNPDDYRGVALITVVLGMDSPPSAWRESTRLLRKWEFLRSNGVETVLWITRPSPASAASVFRRLHWFEGMIVGGTAPGRITPSIHSRLPDGTPGPSLILDSSPGLSRAVNRLVNECLRRTRRSRAGWGDNPFARTVRRLAYFEGDLSGAHNELLRGARRGVAQGEIATLQAELSALVDLALRRIRHDTETGRPGRAALLAGALFLGTKKPGALASTARTALAALPLSSDPTELELEQRMEGWLAGLRAASLDTADAGALQALLRGVPDSPVRRRAQRLLDLLGQARALESGR